MRPNNGLLWNRFYSSIFSVRRFIRLVNIFFLFFLLLFHVLVSFKDEDRVAFIVFHGRVSPSRIVMNQPGGISCANESETSCGEQGKMKTKNKIRAKKEYDKNFTGGGAAGRGRKSRLNGNF